MRIVALRLGAVSASRRPYQLIDINSITLTSIHNTSIASISGQLPVKKDSEAKMVAPLFFSTFEVTRQVFHRTALAYAIVNLKPIVPGRTCAAPAVESLNPDWLPAPRAWGHINLQTC